MPSLSASSVYQGLLSRFANSPVIGTVPFDGARYGITTGSASEFARFGTAFAGQESSFNPNSGPPNATEQSFGLFQYNHDQVPGGNAFDPNASMDAFVRDVNTTVGNTGGLNSGLLGARFSQTTFNFAANTLGGMNAIADPPYNVTQGLSAGSNLDGGTSGFSNNPSFNPDGSPTFSTRGGGALTSPGDEPPTFTQTDTPGNTSNLTGGVPQEGDTLGTGALPSDQLSGGVPTTGDSVTGEPASLGFGSSGGTGGTGGTGGSGVQAGGVNPDGSTELPTINVPGGSGGGGGGGGGGGAQTLIPSGGNGGGGGGGGGLGGAAGAGGGLPLDIQTLGPGTTQPIQKWVDEALKAGGDWVKSAEGVATNAIKAGQTYGSNLLGGVTNWFVRAFLIFIGALLVIVGLIVLMWDHGGEQVATKAASLARA